ncbi:hypothetical protein FE391_16875 [Nonomuraea sp. KC401]|uniref:hypothetical protein n=1 Tax=unclassified Nonomuraea TaxID=2593643 RepID=UPI0010FED4AC|nr:MULTISPECIES: hypothetical protein [unclassified Nonomuraea]NBE95278.1 hypothetical protein [Nonomuraea sp. K271]TLF72376.1 hypothetical protein FE391_16875 [Nonomuraea sp. KC401]
MLKPLITTLVALVILGAWAGPAWAHGRSGEADVRFAQTIAGMEITVVVRASLQVPAPLQVDVVAHAPGRGGRIDLAIRPVEGGRSSSGMVRVEAGSPGMYPVVLSVDRVGPHELEVRAGGERSVLPFAVLVPQAPLWEVVVYAAFACAAVALVSALVSAALSRRLAAAGFAGGVVVATVVAFTAGLLSPWFAPRVPEGAPPASRNVMLGRPNAQPVIAVLPGEPSPGSEFRLRVELFDGSTGGPVDDLVEHHAALSHVVVTNQDGSYFHHVHPIRTAPGTYEVRLRAQEQGRHWVYAEFERADAGGQLVTGEFTVGGPKQASDGVPTVTGAASGGVPVTEPAQPEAGRPVRVTLDTGVASLQPWLGMAGHLVVRSQDGGFLGHVHEVRSMVPGSQRVPDESVAAYAPKLEFTFSFPRPGRYLMWIQYAKNYEIVTVPHVVEVRGTP